MNEKGCQIKKENDRRLYAQESGSTPSHRFRSDTYSKTLSVSLSPHSHKIQNSNPIFLPTSIFSSFCLYLSPPSLSLPCLPQPLLVLLLISSLSLFLHCNEALHAPKEPNLEGNPVCRATFFFAKP